MDIAPFDYPERTALNVQLADIRDAAAVERAMAGADIVVHCAASLPLSSKEEIYSTDVEGTRTLLESAARHTVARFIFMSSTSVYGISDHHRVYEDDELHGVGHYGIAKISAERLGVFELLYDCAYSGKNFPVLGSGENSYQLLDVADLCDVIVSCATLNNEAVNDTFNVGAKVFGNMRDNFQSVLDRAGHAKHVIALPVRPVIALLKLLESLHLSLLYQWIYETAARESFVSIDRIESKLGFAPRYSNRMALIRNYDWYVENRADALGKAGVTHCVPWKKGALQLTKWFF